MSCKFYGAAAAAVLNTLIESGGNQCALITEAHAPCRMETAGLDPDLEACELNGSARAIAFAEFQRRGMFTIVDIDGEALP